MEHITLDGKDIFLIVITMFLFAFLPSSLIRGIIGLILATVFIILVKEGVLPPLTRP